MEHKTLGRVRGTMWYAGTGVTGTSPQGAIFPSSGVTKAYVNDMYLNSDITSDRGNVYVCTLGGNAATAKWAYQMNIRGPLPDLVDNLTSHSTTKALSANQGRVLNEKIMGAGIYPKVVYPDSESMAFTAKIVIENESTTFTITDSEGNEGTYSYTKIGALDDATLTITIGTSIGLPQAGAIIKSIASSDAAIKSYTLYNSVSTVIASDTPAIWEHINDDELNIVPGSSITDGLNSYRTGVISKIIDGVRKQLFPQTHAKAVWYDKSQNKTVYDQLQQTDITAPTATGSFTYDGTTKTVTISAYDNTKIEIQGTTSAINAGTYYCTAVLKDSYHYKWDDGTNSPKEFTWTIAKAAGPLTLSANSVSGQFIPDSSGAAIISTVTAKSQGTVTATCQASIGTVLVSGNDIKYTPTTAGTDYSGTITVTDSGDDNHDASTQTITLTNVRTLKMVTWANGTDAEVAAMVKALDDQLLTIDQTGWSVGDERSVSLSAMAATGVGESHAAQTVKMVLMDTDKFTLTTPTSGGKTKSSFVVGLKNSLAETGYMNSTNTNAGSWNSSARRTWCNSVFKPAIPETLRNCFKQFKVVTASEYNASTTTTSNDYFALFAEKEIFGASTYSNATEAGALTQIKYYEASANRIKKLGETGSAANWWERSPCSSNATTFCYVNAGGTALGTGASNPYGLAPFGCL